MPRFIPFIYSNFYVADVCMTVPSGKLICPPTGFVILHFEVQWVYTVYRSLSRIMFPVPTIACSGSIHRFHRYSCFFCFFTFYSYSSFFPVPHFHLFYCLFSPFLWDWRRHKMSHKGWRVVKPQQSMSQMKGGQQFLFWWWFTQIFFFFFDI